jgi:hypothetical protein
LHRHGTRPLDSTAAYSSKLLLAPRRKASEQNVQPSVVRISCHTALMMSRSIGGDLFGMGKRDQSGGNLSGMAKRDQSQLLLETQMHQESANLQCGQLPSKTISTTSARCTVCCQNVRCIYVACRSLEYLVTRDRAALFNVGRVNEATQTSTGFARAQ